MQLNKFWPEYSKNCGREFRVAVIFFAAFSALTATFTKTQTLFSSKFAHLSGENRGSFQAGCRKQ